MFDWEKNQEFLLRQELQGSSLGKEDFWVWKDDVNSGYSVNLA